jgi:hypothetical protein
MSVSEEINPALPYAQLLLAQGDFRNIKPVILKHVTLCVASNFLSYFEIRDLGNVLA